MAIATPSFFFDPQGTSGTVPPFPPGTEHTTGQRSCSKYPPPDAAYPPPFPAGHHELVDDLRRQLCQPHHLSGPLNEAPQVIIFARSGFQSCLYLRNGLFQTLQLGFLRYCQRGKAFLRQQALVYILVTFPDRSIALCHPLFGLLQLPLSGGQFLSLLQPNCFP